MELLKKHKSGKTDTKFPQGKALLNLLPLRAFTINQCIVRLRNGVKEIFVYINITSLNPTLYFKTYDNDLDAGQQTAFDDLVSWANTLSGGDFPTPLPDPIDPNDPILDQITITIFNGNKYSLSYRAHTESNQTIVTYANLDGSTQADYDTLCNWAETVDNRFLS